MTRPRTSTTLPGLDAAERAHVARMRAELRTRIVRAGGWLAFDDYMDCVLYAPGLGYYSAGATKFGAGGDFVTAPEISDLFARAFARQFADVLAVTGGGVLEAGPGSGRFARVVLGELGILGHGDAPYSLLEVSADLRERQRDEIGRNGVALALARWLDRPPAGHVGVIFANELLDALPCDRFRISGGRPQRLGVALGADGPHWAQRAPDPNDPADAAWLAEVEWLLQGVAAELPEGYCGELSPRTAAWVRELGSVLERGVVILVDYGLPRRHYYHPQRLAGTLRCHFRQRAHDDPFLNPGLTDVTAWVDFTRIAEAAEEAGLEVAAFATQAAFLLSLGIESLADEQVAGGPRWLAQMQGLKRLLLPGEMGEAVKVMVLARGWDAALRGGRLQDLRGSL
jgi:SAM-dependent MidA family methyltransferase